MGVDLVVTLLFTLNAALLVAVLFLCIRLWRSVSVVDSSENLVGELRDLKKTCARQTKSSLRNAERLEQAITGLDGRFLRELSESIDKLGRRLDSELSSHEQILKGYLAKLDSMAAGLRESFETTSGELSGVREYASKQQEVLRRFQEGYDLSIKKSFATGVASVIDWIRETIKEKEAEELKRKLKQVSNRLTIVLENQNIEEYWPEDGQNVQEIKNFTTLTKEETTEASKENIVLRAVRPAYIYQPGESPGVVIRQAEAVIGAISGKED